MSAPFARAEQVPVQFEQALAALDGDAPLLVEVVKMLLVQMDVDLNSIRADVAVKNSTALAQSSHRLKGSLGAITAAPAFLACADLNPAARISSTQSYASGLTLLEHELSRLRSSLQAWLTEHTKC